MADGAGNLEEQIRCVGEQITRMEERIERVQEKIERVEEQIAGCPDVEERKLLRGRKAQLRHEEAQRREQILQGRGHPLAVVVQALLKEVVAYTKIKELWGGFVPRLTGYGTTNKGQVVFVAIELIEGVDLGKVVATEEVTTAVHDAVHACGLLHGDVYPSNIMVVWGKQPPVRVLDFGFSCVTSYKKAQKAERVHSERLFK